jgi:hypothetical protein
LTLALLGHWSLAMIFWIYTRGYVCVLHTVRFHHGTCNYILLPGYRAISSYHGLDLPAREQRIAEFNGRTMHRRVSMPLAWSMPLSDRPSLCLCTGDVIRIEHEHQSGATLARSHIETLDVYTEWLRDAIPDANDHAVPPEIRHDTLPLQAFIAGLAW